MIKLKLLLYVISILVSILAIQACASTGRLTGGPRDEQPPKMDTLLSSQALATNVEGKEFKFVFDEFIEVRNAIQEVLVSPPLTYIPKITSRGKTLILQFNEKEKLKDSTTYVVNFGNAIVDLNESNPLKNFSYVFSTGPVIDSLGVEGVVIDAVNKTPLEDITILLYDDLSDSVFLNKKPFYASKSSKDGEFKIKNVKRDSFRIFAVKDENKSYTYNMGTEQMGFLEPILVFDDTTKIYRCSLEVSMPAIDYKIFDSDQSKYGYIKQKWNTNIEKKPKIVSIKPLDTIFTEFDKDTVYVWYKTKGDTLSLDFGFTQQQYRVPAPSTSPKSLGISNTSFSNTLAYLDSVQLRFSHPILAVDTALIEFKDTSGINIRYQISQASFNRINIIINEDKSTMANLRIKKGAFVDIFGNKCDTAFYNFTLINDAKTAEIDIKVLGLDSSKYYQINFKDGNDNVLQSYIAEGVSSIIIKKGRLRPESYKVEVIEDTNKNGFWDPVNWWKKTQAERKKILNIDKLRENWTLETELEYKVDD